MMMTQDNNDTGPLTLYEYTNFLNEVDQQPPWRAKADKEMDYIDGNQLDSELLRKQKSLGIPPAMENVMKPAIQAVIGFEAKTRTDWRVTPDGEPGGRDVADALNFKLNQAEKQSKADKACSDAFKPQFSVGLGWVEVSRQSDPFEYPYRAVAVHRNEIHFDMKCKPDLSDARWLMRRRWMHTQRIVLTFPDKKDLIEHASGRWMDRFDISIDGGNSTGLSDSWAAERGWSVEEQRWYDATNKTACLAEVWYRRWVKVLVLKSPDGRVVEFDQKNQAHLVAAATGTAQVQSAVIARVRRSYWLGPHCLHDGPSPYTHRYFPYVPFWGDREDVTGVPYGAARHMIYAQDSLNSGISKLRWGMSAVRSERTKGAVAMSDALYRQMVARVDADIILNAEHMAQPGATYKVTRDFQLNEQQYRMLDDSRNSVARASGITAAFEGKQGSANSGLQEQTQVEQSTQSLAGVMDNFRTGRTMVGEILLSFIIEDLGNEPKVIVIEGDAVREDRTVMINKPEVDPATGVPYLSNDVQRTRLKVALEDVPTSSSFRAQQLSALSEAVKSMTPQMQQATMPYLFGLMDMPYQRELIQAIRAAGQADTPEAVDQRIKQAVQDALAKAGNDIKSRELDLKERKAESEIRQIDATSVQIGVQAAFSAMQAGAQVAQMPMIAPIADQVMQGAGYVRPNPMGDDPNFPTPATGAPMQATGAPGQMAVGPGVHRNTSPEFPPVPQQAGSASATEEAGEPRMSPRATAAEEAAEPASPMDGIETARTADNLHGSPA